MSSLKNIKLKVYKCKIADSKIGLHRYAVIKLSDDVAVKIVEPQRLCVVQAGYRVKTEIYKQSACGTKKEHKKLYK
jgi:hypothetical protein